MQYAMLDNVTYDYLCENLSELINYLNKKKIVEAVIMLNYSSTFEECVDVCDIIIDLIILINEHNLKQEEKILNKIYNIIENIQIVTNISVDFKFSLASKYSEFGIYYDRGKGYNLNHGDIIYDRNGVLTNLKKQIANNDRFFDEFFENLEINPPLEITQPKRRIRR